MKNSPCYRRRVPAQQPQDPDQLVTAERSMFGTRLPRPTGVGRHLIVVILVSAIALGVVIWFAERAAPAPAPEAPVPG
jgi:hypothetical protein